MWFLPFAIVTGNTFVLKPSEQVPLSQRMMVDFLRQCDLPPGVVNLVNGGRDVVDAICDHPGIRAVSFVGSTPVARHVYQRATHAGKRAQALGGAKNFVVIMPDADFDRADRRHLGIVLWLRRRALPRRQHADSGRRCASRGARPHGRRGQGAEGRRRHDAGRDDGTGDQRRASRQGARLHRKGRQRGRAAAGRRTDHAGRGPAQRLLRRPDGVRQRLGKDGDRP